MSGAFVRRISITILLLATGFAHATPGWTYSPGNVWDDFRIYSLDQRGLKLMQKDPADDPGAEQLFHEVLAIRGNDPLALVLLGRCEARSGEYERAMADISVALRYWPASGVFYSEQAAMELDRGYSELALASMQQALDLEPESDASWLRMGRIHEARGEVEEAIQSYRHAITLNERSILAHNYLAVMLYYQGRQLELAKKNEEAKSLYAEVAKELQIVNSLDSTYFPVYMSSGAILWNMGAFDKAELAFSNAVYLQPKNVEALTSLAMVQLKLKKKAHALRNLRAALTLDPKNPRAHFFVGSVLSDDGFLKLGLEHLQLAVQLDAERHDRAVDPIYLKKFEEVKRRYTASTRPVKSP